MESGYDGLQAAEKKLGAKITVKYIENVKFGDMEQVLVALAGKNELVIGVGGQTQASVFKVAPRFPKVKFAIIGGNADPKKPANVSGYDVRQAEIGFVAGAAAAMLSKTGAVSYVGGLEIPAIKNTGIEFGNGARYVNPEASSTSRTTPATSTTSPRPRKRRSPPSPRAPTCTTTSSTSACAAWSRRRARRART